MPSGELTGTRKKEKSTGPRRETEFICNGLEGRGRQQRQQQQQKMRRTWILLLMLLAALQVKKNEKLSLWCGVITGGGGGVHGSGYSLVVKERTLLLQLVFAAHAVLIL